MGSVAAAETRTEKARSAALTLGPALPVLALMIWWAADQGGYSARKWYPGGLLVAGVLTALVLGRGALPRLGRPTRIALAGLAGYTAWSFLSIIWAQAPGDALEGANRTLLYLGVFVLASFLPWRPRHADLALGAVLAGFGVVALVTLVRIGTDNDPSGLYIYGRLASPLGYQNATAALWTMTTLLALVVAARRNVPVLLRGPALGIAVITVDLALMSQSRGWLFSVPLVLILAVATVPSRVRFMIFAIPVAVAAAASAPTMLDVYDRARQVKFVGKYQPRGALATALSDIGAHAMATALWAAGIVAVLGIVIAGVDARIEVPRGISRATDRLATIAAVLALVGGAGAGLVATHGHLGRELDKAWTNFKTYQHPRREDTNRFSSLGSSRYDFWRVGLDVWRDHPLAGIGQDNFAEAYLLNRRSAEEPRWVHSLPLRLLVHTGVIGALLFLVFLLAAIRAAWKGAVRRTPAGMTQAACLLPLIVWLVHGSLDWFWEYPGLTVPALWFLGVAGALRIGPAGPEDALHAGEPSGRRFPRRAAVAAVAATSVIGGLVLVPPYLAAYQTQTALGEARTDPTAAVADLERAADLNPLSDRASLTAGVIALQGRNLARARSNLEEAARRRPKGWDAKLELAVVASEQGRADEALTRLREAVRLNPRDPVLRAALRLVKRGGRLNQASLAFQLADRTGRVVGHRPGR